MATPASHSTACEDALDETLNIDLPSHPDSGAILRRLGVVTGAFAAIQIDINAAKRRVNGQVLDATLCDHNCTTEVGGSPTGGQYTCPAALSLNLGVRRHDLAPGDHIIRGLETTIEGIRRSRPVFFRDVFPWYCDAMAVPPRISERIRDSADSDNVVVNLFGGSPELHPSILDIIRRMHALDGEVHLTTTGRRLLRDAPFRRALLDEPPDLVALGADDFVDGEDIERMMSADTESLEREWKAVPWQYGQRKKAYEAVLVMKSKQEDEQWPPLLFNIVLHPGNLGRIHSILDALTAADPDATLNPYPAQTAFLGTQSSFTDEHLLALERFIDVAIAQHLLVAEGRDSRWRLAPRIHYWLMLKAACEVFRGTAGWAQVVAGAGIWTCYSSPGAGRCVQIASSMGAHPHDRAPGGHLGCYWNAETVTDARQVWEMSSEEVADWVLNGRGRLALESRNRCQGCAFPRMSFDAVSLEIGLGDEIRPKYLALRGAALGY